MEEICVGGVCCCWGDGWAVSDVVFGLNQWVGLNNVSYDLDKNV